MGNCLSGGESHGHADNKLDGNATGQAATIAEEEDPFRPIGAAEALKMLIEGNARFRRASTIDRIYA